MPVKAVYCNSQFCRHRYHQEVDLSVKITVHCCPQCGTEGIMIVKPDEKIKGLPCARFKKPRIELPLLSLPVNKSFLYANATDIDLLHGRLISGGFTLVGFHGTKTGPAASILQGVQDVSTTNSRGRGFAVGSLYTGLPSSWSKQSKGIGSSIVLRVYVHDWSSLTFGLDFDWGKMDPGDKVAKTGLEMVLRPRTFDNIFTLPSKSSADQELIPEHLWDDCPAHNFRPEEMEKVTKLARHMKITLLQLETMINKGQIDAIQKAADELGITLD